MLEIWLTVAKTNKNISKHALWPWLIAAVGEVKAPNRQAFCRAEAPAIWYWGYLGTQDPSVSGWSDHLFTGLLIKQSMAVFCALKVLLEHCSAETLPNEETVSRPKLELCLFRNISTKRMTSGFNPMRFDDIASKSTHANPKLWPE